MALSKETRASLRKAAGILVEDVEHEKEELERGKEEENHIAGIRKHMKSARAMPMFKDCAEVFDKIEAELKKLDELHAKAKEEDVKEVKKEEKK